MNGPNEKQITRMHVGQRAEALSGAFEEEITARMQAIDKRIFLKMASGEAVDPQYALQAWAEKFGLHSLIKSLDQKARIGQGAAQKIAPQMNGEHRS